MAAAGPRGRDGPSPREFTAVRHFMMADLGLSGLPLLVYARIFGFCDAGCGYFESKGGLARFLNVQERSVHRAIRDLLDRGLIEECGVHALARGYATKRAVPHRAREAAARSATARAKWPPTSDTTPCTKMASPR